MFYQSPLHVLEKFNINPDRLTRLEIVRLRKQLLAEFNLENQVTLSINDKQFSKDEIIRQIDLLKNLEDLETHIQIYQNKEVLSFCEDPKKLINPIHAIITLFEEKDTTENCRKIILESQLQCLKSCLNSFNYKGAIDIVGFLNIGNCWSKDNVFDIIEMHLTNLEYEIDNTHSENFKHLSANIHNQLARMELYLFLNALPEGFNMHIENIGIAIINLTVRLQVVGRYYVVDVSYCLLNLKCSNENMDLIKSNHQIFQSNTDPYFAFSDFKPLIIIAIIIGPMLFVKYCKREIESPRIDNSIILHNVDSMIKARQMNESIKRIK